MNIFKEYDKNLDVNVQNLYKEIIDKININHQISMVENSVFVFSDISDSIQK
ncbi:hypothetical protein PL321_06480 [Caloramator sp. mosi_1]|uniref:hypothetical protein n=1 Tax=Caloramator sp. mosi_1 TaxID=3023090 RepID=UPI00236285B9|nr:hypothetical protein [Caloramator sp. mosi_1]WDC85133.1 hypothetical protein PL321_06480 [Caloramator sp. mosi_1]